MLSQWDVRGVSEGFSVHQELLLSYRETAGNLSPGIPRTGNWVNAEQARSTEEVKPND